MLRAAGIDLAGAAATARAVLLLESGGIAPIVLRGPWQTRRLSREGRTRYSSDIDLLVPVGDVRRAHHVLHSAGYRCLGNVDFLASTHHSSTWENDDDPFSIDLHTSLVGVNAVAESVWHVLRKHTQERSEGDVVLTVPDTSATLTIVALHAAQHGISDRSTLADLRRALLVGSDTDWSAAAEIAAELQACSAMRVGLALVAHGLELADRLQLGGPTSRSVILRAQSPPPTALGLESFFSEATAIGKLRFIRAKLFPPRVFMADWHPWARRQGYGMFLAYLYRLVWLIRWTPSGYRAWRSANHLPCSRQAERVTDEVAVHQHHDSAAPYSTGADTHSHRSVLIRFPHRRRFALAVQALRRTSSELHILDYGAGDGELLISLLRSDVGNQVSKAIGYEPVQHILDDLTDRVEREGLGHRITGVHDLQDVHNMERFDFIFCLSVLEHLPLGERLAFYRLCQDRLKPTGAIIVEVPVEIGFSLIIKHLGRTLIKKRASEQSIGSLCRGLFGMPKRDVRRFDPFERSFIRTHHGFDYRTLREELATVFSIESSFGSPFRRLSAPLGNQEIFFVMRTREPVDWAAVRSPSFHNR